jgi:hypothetical protein
MGQCVLLPPWQARRHPGLPFSTFNFARITHLSTTACTPATVTSFTITAPVSPQHRYSASTSLASYAEPCSLSQQIDMSDDVNSNDQDCVGDSDMELESYLKEYLYGVPKDQAEQ